MIVEVLLAFSLVVRALQSTDFEPTVPQADTTALRRDYERQPGTLPSLRFGARSLQNAHACRSF